MVASCSARSTRVFSQYRCARPGCSKRSRAEPRRSVELQYVVEVWRKTEGKTATDAPKTRRRPESIPPSLPQLSRTPPPPLMFSPPVLHTIFHPPLLFPLTALNRGLTVWADGGRVGGARGSAVAAGSVQREGFHEVPQQHPGNQWLHWGPSSLLGQPGFL